MFADSKDRTNGDRPVFDESTTGAVPKDRPEQTAASLRSDILADLQRLVEQQFQWTRREVADEIRKRAIAAAVFALGATILFLGAIVFCFGLVDLLHWATLPGGTNSAGLPLWECCALVAAVLAVIGGFVAHVGRLKFRSTAPFYSPISELMQEHGP